MKASTERNIMRWLHIILSVPIVGYIYGPVASSPEVVTTVRWILFAIVIVSGFWMWKGHWVRKWFATKIAAPGSRMPTNK